jgi:type II secretory pathway pseudopilin PulG
MKNNQSGQTLIETLAAVFVLSMGITAVVGLATFSLNSSTNVNKQVIGIGLVRQGIEAVKNMRDTNWLWQASVDTDCYNFKNDLNTATCYRSWLDNSLAYTIAPSPSNTYTYVLSFNPDPSTDTKFSSGDTRFWRLTAPTLAPNGPGFTLYAYPLGSNTKYFYDTTSSSGQTPSGYYRSITITKESSPTPFDKAGVGPLIRVISRVWWADKKCPVPDPNTYPTSGSCRVTLETVLTNWKTN